MALNSPGVEVQVIDESFYVPAEPSTRPLIILASAENKSNASGTGVAVGTLKANAERPYLVTSQRELTELFGTPKFYKDASQNPIHGGELNEYGLQAAYSFLGVANSCFVMRANLNLNELISRAEAPGDNPAAGTYWLDTQNTRLGIFEWNGESSTVAGGQKYTNKIPLIITDSTQVDELTGAPKDSVGAIGSYAMVAITSLNKLYYKNRAGTWVLVGSNDWYSSWPAVRASKSNPTITAGHSMVINGVTVVASGATIATLANDINSANIRGVTAAVVASRLEIYSDGATDSPQLDSSASNAIVIAAGTGTLVTADLTTSSVGIVVGTYYGPAMNIAAHTKVPRFKRTDPYPRPSGSLWIKTTDVNLGARWRVKLWNENTLDWDNVDAPLYANNEEAIFKLDRPEGGANIATGTLYVQFNVAEDTGTDDTPRLATFKIFRRERPDPTAFTSKVIQAATFAAGSYNFTMAETLVGVQALSAFKTISVTLTGAANDVEVISAAINAAGFAHIEASVDTRNRLLVRHVTGGDIRMRDGANTPLTFLGYTPFDLDAGTGTANLYLDPQDPDPLNPSWYIGTNWKPLVYVANIDPPTSLPATGRLWYSSILDEVDIMIHNGNTWVSYLDQTSPYYDEDDDFQTDPLGPIVSATQPTRQSDGTLLRHGDIWIDTSDIENYPVINKWDGFNLVWVELDKTDQTTEDGILFADARYNTSGVNSNEPGLITDLLVSNFLDFDAPDPDLYPRGMLLFNTRRSGFNVKKFVRNYVDNDADNLRFNNGETMEYYYPHRWVNESGIETDGSGIFGRKAQRKVVVKYLKAMTDTNQDIRDFERNPFNLMAAPGYCELIANMINLNIDRKQTAFVIGDTPFRLPSDATSLNEWATNSRLVTDNGENGLVSFDEYLGVYYPSGFTTDNTGEQIVVPPSHMVLRTIALSDNVSFPWIAPAGLRRGGVSNASSIGYIDAQEGEFRSIAINEGQRDVLYANGINPITFVVGSGLVVFGQKTRARAASSLDRVNVARLVVYLRGQLDKLAKPYIFEPNDKITRDEIKAAADSLMLELVGQRAIYDFLTVCDETNNTPTRIDRNELYLDIAIEPVKAVEFIYIPLRLKNTGEIAGL
jgi:Phage tail sheath C-terminal domain